MKRIVIACSPRTGSNLLMHSLATHPQAVCGGEWNQPYESRAVPEWWRNKTDRPGAVNLCKVFAPEKIPFENTMIVYLYRSDRDAQLASWRKASATGTWMAGMTSEPTEFPSNAADLIEQAESQYRPIADVAISYEELVSRWDETISTILTTSGWDPASIVKQCDRISSKTSY